MKKNIYFFTILLSLAFFTNCSSDDDNSSLTQLEQQMVGIWNTSPDLTGNTYQYKSDKSAVYVNTWTNGTKIEVTTYEGAWDIIDGNILIEYYPDEDENWDTNWKEHPTLKNKIDFTDDNTLTETSFYESTNINTLYREGVVLKGSEKTHKIDFTTGTLEGWVSVSLETTLDFTDRTQKVVNSNFNTNENIISVEIPKNVTHFKIKFYIEDSSPVNMKFYTEDNKTIIHEEALSQKEYLYEYTFK